MWDLWSGESSCLPSQHCGKLMRTVTCPDEVALIIEVPPERVLFEAFRCSSKLAMAGDWGPVALADPAIIRSPTGYGLIDPGLETPSRK